MSLADWVERFGSAAIAQKAYAQSLEFRRARRAMAIGLIEHLRDSLSVEFFERWRACAAIFTAPLTCTHSPASFF